MGKHFQLSKNRLRRRDILNPTAGAKLCGASSADLWPKFGGIRLRPESLGTIACRTSLYKSSTLACWVRAWNRIILQSPPTT